ncbi:hypothetical protein C8F04DRAFT_1278995 [Mycena alexandri]|uniref:Uncharacterized protein n=1 Tax=Mycena alexandri TaxID=1745969 RepID=A0AAD6S2F4_9AGAR|nr:hypothetical protein C8F04DRAFT_1278995 [Mycena alexandri]
MPPTTWCTPAQTAWLTARVPEFLTAQAEHTLYIWRPRMQQAWFAENPEEALLGLPGLDAEGNAPDLTAEQSACLGAAQLKRMDKLENWFRNHSKKVNTVTATQRSAEESLASLLFEKKEPRQRPLRAIERFQKMYPKEVDTALEEAGFYDASERDISDDLLENESREDGKQRQIERLSARMKIRTRVVRALYDDLSDEGKESIEEMMEQEKKEFAERGKNKPPPELAADGTAIRRPEQYQVAIDEAPEVLVKVHRAIQLKTGWSGFTVLGGPNPRYGGGLSMKVVSFGKTVAGNDFETAHVAFDDAVSKPFQAFLKRSFPLAVRRGRALQTVETPDVPLPPLDGLFRLSDEKTEAAATELPKRKKAKRKKKKKAAPAGSIAGEHSGRNPFRNPLHDDFANDNFDNDNFDNIFGTGNDDLDKELLSGDDESNDSHKWPPGMPQPSSPATAGLAAAAERGGLPGGATYVSSIDHLIDPQLQGDGTPVQRPKPRAAHLGTQFYQPAPPSPTAAPHFRFFQHLPKSTSVLGFTFPSPTSSAPPADVGAPIGSLLGDFRQQMSSPPNPAAASSIAARLPANAAHTTSLSSARGGSSPEAPKSSARGSSTAAALTILANFPGPAPVPAAPVPAAPVPAAPAPPIFINSRPMAKPPVVAKTKAVAAPKVKATTGKQKAAAKVAEKATKVAEKAVGGKKGKTGGKGKGKAWADDGEDDAGGIVNAAIQSSADATTAAGSTSTSSPSLIYRTSGASRTMAFNRRADAAMAARDAAERKANARVFNPDGPTPIVCVPARRSSRKGQPTRLADDTLAQLPSRGSRADQIRRREQQERDEEELSKQLLVSPMKRRASRAKALSIDRRLNPLVFFMRRLNPLASACSSIYVNSFREKSWAALSPLPPSLSSSTPPPLDRGFHRCSRHPHPPSSQQRFNPMTATSSTTTLAMDAYHDWFVNSWGVMSRDKDFLWEYVEPGPIWAVKNRIEWAPTFRDICRFLPLCNNLADAFEVEDDVDVQVAPIYYVVDGSDRVTANVDEAIATWLAVDHEWGAIMATRNIREACLYGTDNRLQYGSGNAAGGKFYPRCSRRPRLDDERLNAAF